MDYYVKKKSYGNSGNYYLEYVRLSIPSWESYFFKSYDYDYDTINDITNKSELVNLLEIYFRHNLLYGEDKVTNKIEEVIDDYIHDYLERVPDSSFRIMNERKFINLKDITFHPQDYPTSLLAHPSISDYYYRHEEDIRNDLKEKFIAEEWEKYVEQVIETLLDGLRDEIRNKKKVIWEVPHTIYKSTEPFTIDDIRTGKVKPYVMLDKYEHEFFDYEIGFNEIVYYSIIEHLPGGDYILNANWNSLDYNFTNTENDGLYTFFIPYPYISWTPHCRRRRGKYVHYLEGRFPNTRPAGGRNITCGYGYNRDIIHLIKYHLSKNENYDPDDDYSPYWNKTVTANTSVKNLGYSIRSSSDIRDYDPPKILETDEWYTEEHFGDYYDLKPRTQEDWWEDYRDNDITTVEDWHEFWSKSSNINLASYINNHIIRENKL